MKPMGRVGDVAFCPSDSHGCPACAHPVTGPAVTGSPDVVVNSMPALRVDDRGAHSACCGPNTWQASDGAPHVFINHKPAFRMGDPTKHCGGDGHLVVGSPDVLVGDDGATVSPGLTWIRMRLVDEDGEPVANARYRLTLPGGSIISGTAANEWLDIRDIDFGAASLEIEVD